MKNIKTIFLKELKRVFTDRRMLLAMFLPGILIFIIYTFMGNFMQNDLISTKVKDTTYHVVYTDNFNNDENAKLPQLITYLDATIAADKESNNKVEYSIIKSSEVTTYKEKVTQQDVDLLISFSDDFENKHSDVENKSNISLFYNGETNASSNIYSIANGLVSTVYDTYTVNFEENKPVIADLGKKNIVMQRVISFIFPILTISILYSTITSICPEAIAGEKERGTLASLLLTPIKRSEFVLGKIFALSITAVASGIVSFLGTALSLPKMMGLSTLPIDPLQTALLMLIMISTLLLFVGFGVLVSSLSNTVKEAGSYLGPFTILFMMLGIVPLLLPNNLFFAFIPVLNISSCMNAIFMGGSNLLLLLIFTLVSNVVYTVLFVYIITRLFNKERVVLGQ